ncbi:serine hydrolase [Pseudomonas alcaligenes]|uniref:Serine hydrolase n=1 Tax=Aquipseudomonas alcaligenes TaxID=43263 RepID=A0ABR7S223_AQUAC|nr:serine hydrolase domain-containing protein [Pseudomonas alcaligenes]MBC9251631.1 serine hydrolase [Pseudomonas alcaligenes]
MRSALVANGVLQTAAQPEPLLPWWSFGKTVLAATALTLVRDGLVGLDDELTTGPFTLRQLLRHEAGLADYGELADYHAAVARHDQPWPVAEMLQRLDASRLRYAPGQGWRYSNVGYLYVAQLIERLTDLPLDQALQQRVLMPLGISQTRLAQTEADWQALDLQAAPSYHPAWVYHGLLVGPLAQAALLLDRLLGGELLPADLLEQMQTPYRLGGPMAGRPWMAPGYGLGLMQGPESGGLYLSGHTGGGPGSAIAVYRCTLEQRSACCAVFAESEDGGAVEVELVRQLRDSLAAGCRD